MFIVYLTLFDPFIIFLCQNLEIENNSHEILNLINSVDFHKESLFTAAILPNKCTSMPFVECTFNAL